MSEARPDPSAPPNPYAGITPDAARGLLRAHGANMPFDRKEALQRIAVSGEQVGRVDPATGQPVEPRALSPFGNAKPQHKNAEDAGYPGEPMVLCDVPRSLTLIEAPGSDVHIHFAAGSRRVPLRFIRMPPPSNIEGDFAAYPNLGMHPALELLGVKVIELPREIEEADQRRQEIAEQLPAKDGLHAPEHIMAVAHETAARIIEDAKAQATQMIQEMVAAAKAELAQDSSAGSGFERRVPRHDHSRHGRE